MRLSARISNAVVEQDDMTLIPLGITSTVEEGTKGGRLPLQDLSSCPNIVHLQQSPYLVFDPAADQFNLMLVPFLPNSLYSAR
jgi:hypothetical protein